MSITVTNQQRVAKPITPNECTIGKHYRRQSAPSKLYVAARKFVDGEATNQPVLISLQHGNAMTAYQGADFIEVDLDVVVKDRLL
ncbi:hypothetical protein tf_14 [Pseudomonas phage tf]|jgi:hypothetical protein|uniref:Uncharacterized protein n=1 Tax=Pseudomonas phage tf TaxID=1114179 RepID=J7SCC7_9CAUD|nr:hypothetical protein tf_14 [Pseudomonas phage tf]CCL97937.1 hypothetical protein tf_14 [Pseudomonas phage tf]